MKALIVLAALTLSSCATTAPATETPTAGLSQTAYIYGVQVRPIAVVEDSRCPINVMCVWAGRLVVRAEIRGAGWRQTRDLELSVPQAVGEYRVALMAAEPSKQAGATIDPGAYRFTFAVSGR